MHNAQYTLFALRALREDGWKLPREGLSSRVRHVIAVVVFFLAVGTIFVYVIHTFKLRNTSSIVELLLVSCQLIRLMALPRANGHKCSAVWIAVALQLPFRKTTWRRTSLCRLQNVQRVRMLGPHHHHHHHHHPWHRPVLTSLRALRSVHAQKLHSRLMKPKCTDSPSTRATEPAASGDVKILPGVVGY